MPAASRDRLSRPVDISTLLRGAARRVDLIVDEPGLRFSGLSRSPAQSVSSVRRAWAHRSGPGRGRVGPIGRENRMVGRRSGGRGRVLPSWYPRTPLRDITAVVRAIERRRAQIRNDQAAEAPQEEPSTAETSSAQLVHEIEASTPMPTLAVKPQPSPATEVPKFLPDMPKTKLPDSDLLTPQKKLLNSIEKVREVWLEEQKKLEKTPAAKKEERDKKVRTLMSMR